MKMEQDVRDAAEALRTAILDAQAAGYKVNWPANAAGLETIEISETAAVTQPAVEEIPEVSEAVIVPPVASAGTKKAKPAA
jgi:hypothetical protein